jgi:hypothetical protein
VTKDQQSGSDLYCTGQEAAQCEVITAATLSHDFALESVIRPMATSPCLGRTVHMTESVLEAPLQLRSVHWLCGRRSNE